MKWSLPIVALSVTLVTLSAHAGVSTTVSANAYAYWLKARYHTNPSQSVYVVKSLANAKAKLSRLTPFLANTDVTSEKRLEVLGAELAAADALFSTESNSMDSVSRTFFEAKLNGLTKAVEGKEKTVILKEISDLSDFLEITKNTFQKILF